MLAVKHFEVYVSSVVGEVVVYSNHSPLTFLLKFHSSNARVFRWSLVLQAYGLVVRHIAGKDNMIADALSRSSKIIIYNYIGTTINSLNNQTVAE